MEEGYKLCPYCANEIKEKAIKCQYCGEFLKKEEKKEEKTKTLKKECPFCMNEIDVITNICPFCNENLDNGYKENIGEKNLPENQLNEKDIKLINSCIKTGQKRRSWGWLSIVGLPFIFVLSIGSRLDTSTYDEATRLIGMIGFALIGIAIYYLIRLVKNYRVLLNSKTEGFACKSCFFLILYWICPIINLIKPQQTIEDLLRYFLNNIGENYDNKLVKKRGILWNITLVSFFLIFCYPTRLSGIAVIVYTIFHSIHMFYLIKIVNKIISAQETFVKNN